MNAPDESLLHREIFLFLVLVGGSYFSLIAVPGWDCSVVLGDPLVLREVQIGGGVDHGLMRITVKDQVHRLLVDCRLFAVLYVMVMLVWSKPHRRVLPAGDII